MALKVSSLVKQMTMAAKDELGSSWPSVKLYASTEAKKLAQTIVMIEKLKQQGRLQKAQAVILLDMQK